MKKLFPLLITLLFLQTLTAQSEKAAIINCLNGYINGTSYNQPDLILSSFMPEANMFLDYQDRPLVIMKVEEYAGRLPKDKASKFTGRVTNILSIEQFEGIAVAKLEVLIPNFDRRFVDILLLKKLEGGWKIISKVAGSEPSKRGTEKVLLVVSSATRHGDSDLPAGNSFSEVVIAYDEYQKAGYHVDIMSPLGGQVPLVYINASDSLQLNYLYNPDFMYALNNTSSPTEINPDDYNIIQFTGGSAPIFDIPQNKAIQDIAMHIYEKNEGVIAAVCHGTAGIVNLKTSDGQYLIANKNVNGVPDLIEQKDKPYYQLYPFIIEKVMKERGGDFKYSKDEQAPHMEVAGRLITGQNFLSSRMVTQKSVEIAQQKSKNK